MSRALWIILLVAAAGCVQAPNDPSSLPSETKAAQIEPTPGPVISQDTLPAPITPPLAPLIGETNTPFYAETQTTTAQSAPACVGNGVLRLPSTDLEISGTILYQTNMGRDLYTIGGVPISNSRLPIEATQYVGSVGFSPAGDRFAFAPSNREDAVSAMPDAFSLGLETPELVVLSATGKRAEYSLAVDIRSYAYPSWLTYPPEWFRSVSGGQWVNEQLMMLDLHYRNYDDSYSRGLNVPRLFDLSTGSWQDWEIDGLPNRDVDGDIGFAPDMSRALYNATSETDGSGFVLRDLENGQVLWSGFNYPYSEVLDIRWAPNSSVVALYRTMAYPGQDMLQIIGRDGAISSYGDSEWSGIGSMISSLEWSPDSQSIAFVVFRSEADGYQETNLYIFDFVSTQYLLDCPLVGYDSSYPPKLVWSPDGTAVALSIRSAHESGPLQIVNVATGDVTQIVDDSSGVYWSSVFPVLWTLH